jgi:hypothetical protein
MLADIIPGISTAGIELGLFILTFILVGVTVALAILTWMNVRAAKDVVSATKDVVSATNKLIELQTEPRVHVEATWNRLQFYEGKIPFNEIPLVIFIKNNGGGPARDVDFAKMEDDFSIKDGNDTFKQAPLVKKGITELAPNQEMVLAWLSIPTVLDINRPAKIEFEYKTLAGKSKPGSNSIDFPALVHSLGG